MLATPLFSLSLLLTSIHAINITIYATSDCSGGLNAIRSRYVVPEDGCFVRGMEDELLRLQGETTRDEAAVAARIDDVPSETEIIALFTSDDCNPDNVIEDAFLGGGCMSESAKDYRSWAVWDTCEGDDWCSLE